MHHGDPDVVSSKQDWRLGTRDWGLEPGMTWGVEGRGAPVLVRSSAVHCSPVADQCCMQPVHRRVGGHLDQTLAGTIPVKQLQLAGRTVWSGICKLTGLFESLAVVINLQMQSSPDVARLQLSMGSFDPASRQVRDWRVPSSDHAKARHQDTNN